MTRGGDSHTSFTEFLTDHREDDILLVFSASWISQSSIVDIVLQKIQNQIPDLIIKQVDVDDNEDLIERFYIKKLPSAVMIKNGQMIHKFTGTFSKKDILDVYNSN